MGPKELASYTAAAVNDRWRLDGLERFRTDTRGGAHIPPFQHFTTYHRLPISLSYFFHRTFSLLKYVSPLRRRPKGSRSVGRGHTGRGASPLSTGQWQWQWQWQWPPPLFLKIPGPSNNFLGFNQAIVVAAPRVNVLLILCLFLAWILSPGGWGGTEVGSKTFAAEGPRSIYPGFSEYV